MKKQLVKHLLHSTAALAVCAVLLPGMPFTGSSSSGGNDKDRRPGVTTEIPDGEDGETEGNSGIAPANDLIPDIEYIM